MLIQSFNKILVSPIWDAVSWSFCVWNWHSDSYVYSSRKKWWELWVPAIIRKPWRINQVRIRASKKRSNTQLLLGSRIKVHIFTGIFRKKGKVSGTWVVLVFRISKRDQFEYDDDPDHGVTQKNACCDIITCVSFILKMYQLNRETILWRQRKFLGDECFVILEIKAAGTRGVLMFWSLHLPTFLV